MLISKESIKTALPPTGLVLTTSNSLQSYDELVECDTENFLEFVDELAEKAVLVKHREEPRRGRIVALVGHSGFEPETPVLSGLCSNQLS